MNSRRIKLAAAAVIGLAISAAVSYAAVEAVVQYSTISEDRVSFTEVQEPNLMVGGGASRKISVGGTSIASEDEAPHAWRSSASSTARARRGRSSRALGR